MTDILPQFDQQVLDRMVRAVELVRERLLRSTRALEAAGIPYAVIGGNAVAAWVSRIDADAVRNTADVDLLIQEEDFERIKLALESAGFVYRHSAGIDFFLDGPDGKFRSAVHMLRTGQKVRPEYLLPTPDLGESECGPDFRVLSLEALVRMKLTSFRDKDKTHLRDLAELCLIDAGWISKYPAELGERLKFILDHPDD